MKRARRAFTLYLLLLLTIQSQIIFAQTNEEKHLSGIYFMQKIKTENPTIGFPVFMYSDVDMHTHHDGNVIVYKSKGTIQGIIEGDVYALNSSVYIHSTAQIQGKIYTFGSTISELSHIRTIEVPAIIMTVIKRFVRVAIGCIILILIPFHFETTRQLWKVKRWSVLYYGSILVLMNVALFLLFVLSIVGFPIVSINISVLWVFGIYGQIIISVMVGKRMECIYDHRWNYFQCYWVGGMILLGIEVFPIVGFIVMWILLPILGLGSAISFLDVDRKQITLSQVKKQKVHDILSEYVKE